MQKENIKDFLFLLSEDWAYDEQVQGYIDDTPEDSRGGYSDGFHTFNELYEFRKVYNAALFREWVNGTNKESYDVHKSRRHYDGELPFGGEYFIVTAQLPSGQISNHYHIRDWDLFDIPEMECAKYEYDGHTPEDVLFRMVDFLINLANKNEARH